MKAPKISWLYIKIGLYGFMLYSVISAMQYVKSTSFAGKVDVLMGSPSQERTLSWCPSSVQVLFLVRSQKTIREDQIIKALCRMDYSSYEAKEIEGIQWLEFMKALDDKGIETILQADSSLKFIKIGGLIYKVETLSDRLDKLGLSQN